MKKLLLLVFGIMLCVSFFAQCVEPPEPPSTLPLVFDRIRNTPAVDSDEMGNGRRFYITTFGLQNCATDSLDHRTKAPLPKPASLVRFGINNATPPWPWYFTNVAINTMDEEIFNQGATPINCYSNDELSSLENAYPTSLTFTDNSQRPEGYMRYHSGTGSWASPILYKDTNGNKHLIILNKSGCLMSVNVSGAELSVDWKLDLRSAERSYDLTNSYKYEFMATPVLIENQIFIAGIKLIHVVDFSTGTPYKSEYPCTGMASNDYFETPMVYDTLPAIDRSFYFISHLGRPYRFSNSLITSLAGSPLGVSQSQPIIDTDGHVYFTSQGLNGGSILSYIEQENRRLYPQTSSIESTDIISIYINDSVKSSIMTDFTRNMYMFKNDEVLRIKELYDFDPYSINTDPIDYPNNFNEWIQSTDLATLGTRFPGNHSLLSYHNSSNKTMLYTLNNGNSSMYESDVISYYPSNLEEYDIYQRNIKLTYVGYNNTYTNPSALVSVPAEKLHRQTWGGIAPYHSSINGYLNALFGDECGGVSTYNSWLSSTSVGFDPGFEIGEDAIPDMGYAKYMKNLDNVPTNNEKDQFKVYLYGLAYNEGSLTFVNAYARENFPDILPGSQISATSATFNKMLPNKRYRITWKDNNNEVAFCENIAINEYSNFVIINADPDIVVEDTPNDPDTETTWIYPLPPEPPEPLHFNSVTLEDNAHWRIADNSNISVTRLQLGSGSRVTIGDGAVLNVDEAICTSTNGLAVFNVDGLHTGKLYVTLNLENTDDSSLQFKGYNLQSPSYNLSTVINKANSILELKSMNSLVTSDLASTTIGSLQNRGRVDINDCVELYGAYVDTWSGGVVPLRGVLKIKNDSDFGNLVWRIGDGQIPSTIQSPFYIGVSALTQPQSAMLTIKDAPCTFKGYNNTPLIYTVYGNIVVKGTAKCIVDEYATLLFETGSKLDLVGNLGTSFDGAEVIVLGTTESPGIIKLKHGVSISGMKPNPAPNDPNRFGDRIITDAFGKILGPNTENPRELLNLYISSPNPGNVKWEGIYINTFYNQEGNSFKLTSSAIDKIDMLYVKYGNNPVYYHNSYSNCTYGIYFDRSNLLAQDQEVTVGLCSFLHNNYGIFVRDNSFSNGQQYLKARITDECVFGGDVPEDLNEYGISLSNCKEAKIDGCDFNNNIFGIFAQDSSILVGGVFDGDGVPTSDYIDAYEPNNFYYNDHAAIWIEHTTAKSLIYNNQFTEQDESNGRYSGMGIYSSDSEVNVMNNSFANLRGHGFLGNLSFRTPPPIHYYHGFSNNSFHNNGGSELIGDAASLSSIKMPLSDPNNRVTDHEGSTWNNPSDIFDYESWDYFLISNLSTFEVAEVYNNTYDPNWIDSPDRFYPDISAFLFVEEPPEPPTSLKALLSSGTEYFYLGDFTLAQETMKLVIETYPDSLETQLAIDFLYLIERATESDFEWLRNYLDLQIPLENMALYMEKEAAKTQCYLKEQDYLSAIQRLQLVIDNPETVADSLFALIDQSYCLYNYASNGAKVLPNCSATTTDFTSYMKFLTELGAGEFSADHETITPISTKIQGNYPNPFNPSTTINYTVPEDGAVKLSIYNIRGQKVIELVNERRNAGNHKIIWTGKDQSGRLVSSGIYFVRIEQGAKSHVRKMMLLK